MAHWTTSPNTLTVCYDCEWLYALHSNVSNPPTPSIEVSDKSVSAILEPEAPSSVVNTSATAAELQAIHRTEVCTIHSYTQVCVDDCNILDPAVCSRPEVHPVETSLFSKPSVRSQWELDCEGLNAHLLPCKGH
eukprot:GHUV01040302.1.p2 GENE.GHUV01040302.1~~GHUV01040302.1.p2  ORF type:complete len:134 (-),score=7.33 GHUV01040302.1:374-775(-)